jgi:hypothetical protein
MEKNSIINTICGFPKEGEFLPDIGSNPNFIFVSDASFETIRLIDTDGNIINVNSWIECAHYVKGGWSTNQESLITSEYTLFLALSLTIAFYIGVRIFKSVWK